MWQRLERLQAHLLLCALLGLTCAPVLAYVEVIRDAEQRKLHLSISDQFSPESRQAIRQWVQHLADSLKLVYGHWPRNYWGIEVQPASGSRNDPIPWAQVHREDKDRVAFYVVSSASATDLKREWTGYHELAHLLLPYRGWGDTWFSEGLASYYQNLLQARSGVITEQQMWQKLFDGFTRGRADDQFDGQPLLSVNQRMREQGGYMRVYWSGAWYFLAADIALRKQSGGRLSLDNALAHLNDCCAEQSLSVAEIIERLDENSEHKLFSRLYQQVYQSLKLPEFEPLLAELGIGHTGGTVHLTASGAQAERRGEFLSSTAL